MFNYINIGCIINLVAAPLKEFTVDDSKQFFGFDPKLSIKDVMSSH